MSTLTTMHAIKITPEHTAVVQDDVPVPQLRSDTALVRVKAVALNPVDWKHVDKIGKGGETLGGDLCGIVEAECSDNQSGTCWRPGDRIAAFVHGGNTAQPEDGAFGDFAIAKMGMGFRVPPFLSDEEAASLPAGVVACCQALYQCLQLPLPNPISRPPYPRDWVLIYGASTATGTLAIQYARLSGFRVIAVCSPHNFELVLSRGAEKAFDHHNPLCAANVSEYTSNQLRLVLDCISTSASSAICESCVSSEGGIITSMLPITHRRSDIVARKALGYTAFGEAFTKFGVHTPAKPEDLHFCKFFFELTERLLEARLLVPHPVQARIGSWGEIIGALDELRQGKISGAKIVYRPEK